MEGQTEIEEKCDVVMSAVLAHLTSGASRPKCAGMLAQCTLLLGSFWH